MIKVEGHPHLYRDPKTGAIINEDNAGYNQYLKSLESRKKQKDEINRLRQELDEIKSLLATFVEGNNKT